MNLFESSKNFSQAPFLVIWETTQSCDLVCDHCRASAQTERSSEELSTQEGKSLLSEIRDMGCSIVVLSGGDPLKRPDLCELVHHGKSLGLRMATIPAATDLLTFSVLKNLHDAGIDQIAFSLDFPNAELHDEFRKTQGAFHKVMQAAEWAKEIGIPLQINTTITSTSLSHLSAMTKVMSHLQIVFWEVFFLVPVGRGKTLPWLTAEQCEQAFEILYECHQNCSFILKVTEAPHYRRFVAQKESIIHDLPYRLRQSEGPGHSFGYASEPVNAGRGFLFVSHHGDIFPSGFLPVKAGNVRNENLSNVYISSPLFTSLRDLTKLKGVCRTCDYSYICGGSRSRAYAITGDYLASEPWCVLAHE